jgi:hypothetical protein
MSAPTKEVITNDNWVVSVSIMNIFGACSGGEASVHMDLINPDGDIQRYHSIVPGCTLREAGAIKELYERWLKDDVEFYWMYRIVDGIING